MNKIMVPLRRTEEIKKNNSKAILLMFAVSIVGSIIFYLIFSSWLISLIALFGLFFLFMIYSFINSRLETSRRIKKIEEVFPDFIELMASNLRAGMTIDKALLLSSRKEFAPLDFEILNLGKDIMTGKDIAIALKDMAKKINSDKIRKTIELIISGIVSGGNLSVLLEETAVSMRDRTYIERKAATNVLMYVIFIFFAVAVGAPVLFGLSSVLVKSLSDILSNVPMAEIPVNLPFSLTKISVSIDFINYFSLIFLVVTDILAALVLGLVNKGEEREGIKYIIPLIVVSVSLFFLVRLALAGFLVGLIG